MNRTFTFKSRAETWEWGTRLGTQLQPGDVVALIGGLGAGKTTLTQAIAQGMRVSDPVCSPTFALIQVYSGSLSLVHADPYRLEDPEELFSLGLEEYLAGPYVVCVEWADRILPLLPADILKLALNPLSPGDSLSEERQITAQASGPRSVAILMRLNSPADASPAAQETAP